MADPSPDSALEEEQPSNFLPYLIMKQEPCKADPSPDSTLVEVQMIGWAYLPRDFLQNMIKKLEPCKEAWPTNPDVVACAGVCSSWRSHIQKLVLAPLQSGKDSAASTNTMRLDSQASYIMELEGEGEVALSTLTEEMEDLANLLEAVQLEGHSADWLDSVQLVQDDVRTFQKFELMRLGKRSRHEEAQTPPPLMQPSEVTNAIREKLEKVRELKSRAPFVSQESGKIPGEISHLSEQMDMLRYLSETKNEAKEQDDQAWLEAVRIVGEEVAAIELKAEELNKRSIDKLAQILKLRGILTSSFPYARMLNIHQYPAEQETVFYKKLASKMSELVSIRDNFLNNLGTSKVALGGEVKDRPELGWNDQVDTIGEEVARIEFEMRKLRKRAVKKLQRVHELKSGGIQPARLPLMNVLVGIDSKMEELKSWVFDDDVGVIGIVGPGGIGKTSLLRQIQSELSLEGYKLVIYVNIKKSSAMLEQVQKEIIQKLDFPWLDDASLRTRAVFNALNRNKFALLLDNVTGMLDLQSIGVPIGLPESKSQNKVIVATESRVICYQMGAERLLVMEGLTEAQAWHLFQQNAWKGIDSTDLEPEFVRLGRLLAENNVLVDLNSGPQEWSVASRICLVDSNNQTLLLQNNTICRVPRGFFRQMPHLKILDLSRTRISEIPSEVGMLGNLRFLNLAYSELTSLPTELGQLAKLAHPDLTCTFSPSVIPHQALPMLSRMQVPYMVGCVDSNDDDEVGSRKLVGHVGGQPGDDEKKICHGGDDERGMGNWKSISYGGDDERGMGNWKSISCGGDDERRMGNWKLISCGGDDERGMGNWKSNRRMGNWKLISCGGDDERGMGNWKLTSHGGADESGMVERKLISHGGDDERMMGNWKLENAPEREPGNWQSHGGDDERGLGHCRLETSSSKDDSTQVSSDDLKCLRQSSDLRRTLGTARFFNSPTLPKYMAVTESAKARVRSDSAPRPPPGTPEKDHAAARKRLSFPVPAPVPHPCYRCRYLFRSPSFKSAKGSLVGEQRSNVSSSYGTASEEKSRRARRLTSGDGFGKGGGRPFSYSTPKTAPRPKQQPPLHRSPATPSPSKARTLYVRATSLPFSYSSPFASVISGAAARNHHKPTVPNYMAATESAKARLRSHSAPP